MIDFDIGTIFSLLWSAAIFFLGWQLRTFSGVIKDLKEDLANMNKVLVDHVTDYDVHKKRE